MKAYEFRLSALRRVRSLREREARSQLALASMRRASAAAELERRRQQLAGMTLQSASTMQELSAVLAAERLAGASVGHARALATSAEEQEREASARWSEAAASLKALESLEGRQRSAHRHLVQVAYGKVLDDVALAGFHREHMGDRR